MKILVIALALIAELSLASIIFVNPVTIKGPNPTSFSAVDILVQDAVTKAGHQITSDKNVADYILTPQLLSLGKSYIFSVQRANKSGIIVDSEKMKSENLSDVDAVISRVTRASLSTQSATQNARIGEVTDNDSKRSYSRIKTRKSFYLGFGPGWADNLNGNNGFSFMGGFAWGMSPEFELLLEYTHYNAKDSTSSMNHILFGGRYFLTQNQHAPYLLGHLGYMMGRHGDENPGSFFRSRWVNGWGLGAGAGMNFFRANSVNFSLQGRMNHLFDDIELSNGGADSGQPNIFLIEMLVNF